MKKALSLLLVFVLLLGMMPVSAAAGSDIPDRHQIRMRSRVSFRAHRIPRRRQQLSVSKGLASPINGVGGGIGFSLKIRKYSITLSVTFGDSSPKGRAKALRAKQVL